MAEYLDVLYFTKAYESAELVMHRPLAHLLADLLPASLARVSSRSRHSAE